MPQPQASGPRRLFSSLAYTALVAIVAGLGYLTFLAINQPAWDDQTTDAPSSDAVPLVEIGSFSPRLEKSSNVERLHVAVQLRINAPGALDAWVFVVARNDHVSPKLWAAWPANARQAITSGGHFRGTNPGSGHQLSLTSGWSRVDASLDHPTGAPAFDTVSIYVVNAKGQVVLVRPFPLPG